MIADIIARLNGGKDLSAEEARAVMQEILKGEASTEFIKEFLISLKAKGETLDEITGFAETMRRYVTRIKVSEDDVLDTCGTGGDNSGTFNISTISALVACGAGARVAKHGNRSVSSKCGSADLLKGLGVNIELGPDKVSGCIKDIGIGFLFAPLLHPAMKYAMPARKAIGERTVFNILGPLTNPAYAKHQLLGVYDEALIEVFGQVLKKLGTTHALIVHGNDGLDEMTTTEETDICELKDGDIKRYKLSPGGFGLKEAVPEELKGGTPEANVRIAQEILKGGGGPKRDIVLLNAGAAIYTADLAEDIKEGVGKAKDSIDSGKALKKLRDLIEYTNK